MKFHKLLGAALLASSMLVAGAANAKTLVYCSEGSPENFYPGVNTTGTSFDGEDISATALLTYASQGDSLLRKRYRGGSLEIQGSGYAELQIGYSLAYGDAAVTDQGQAVVYANSYSAPYWDAFTWDAFTWDGLTLSPSKIDLSGIAENIAVRIDCNGDYFESFTLNSLILQYFLGRRLH